LATDAKLRKIVAHYRGPYTVEKIKGDQTVTVRLTAAPEMDAITVHAQHLAKAHSSIPEDHVVLPNRRKYDLVKQRQLQNRDTLKEMFPNNRGKIKAQKKARQIKTVETPKGETKENEGIQADKIQPDPVVTPKSDTDNLPPADIESAQSGEQTKLKPRQKVSKSVEYEFPGYLNKERAKANREARQKKREEMKVAHERAAKEELEKAHTLRIQAEHLAAIDTVCVVQSMAIALSKLHKTALQGILTRGLNGKILIQRTATARSLAICEPKCCRKTPRQFRMSPAPTSQYETIHFYPSESADQIREALQACEEVLEKDVRKYVLPEDC